MAEHNESMLGTGDAAFVDAVDKRSEIGELKEKCRKALQMKGEEGVHEKKCCLEDVWRALVRLYEEDICYLSVGESILRRDCLPYSIFAPEVEETWDRVVLCLGKAKAYVSELEDLYIELSKGIPGEEYAAEKLDNQRLHRPKQQDELGKKLRLLEQQRAFVKGVDMKMETTDLRNLCKTLLDCDNKDLQAMIAARATLRHKLTSFCNDVYQWVETASNCLANAEGASKRFKRALGPAADEALTMKQKFKAWVSATERLVEDLSKAIEDERKKSAAGGIEGDAMEEDDKKSAAGGIEGDAIEDAKKKQEKQQREEEEESLQREADAKAFIEGRGKHSAIDHLKQECAKLLEADVKDAGALDDLYEDLQYYISKLVKEDLWYLGIVSNTSCIGFSKNIIFGHNMKWLAKEATRVLEKVTAYVHELEELLNELSKSIPGKKKSIVTKASQDRQWALQNANLVEKGELRRFFRWMDHELRIPGLKEECAKLLEAEVKDAEAVKKVETALRLKLASIREDEQAWIETASNCLANAEVTSYDCRGASKGVAENTGKLNGMINAYVEHLEELADKLSGAVAGDDKQGSSTSGKRKSEEAAGQDEQQEKRASKKAKASNEELVDKLSGAVVGDD